MSDYLDYLDYYPGLESEEAAARNNVEIEWDPLPTQERFVESDDRFLGFSGPVGTGKSMALACRAIRMAYINSGRAGCITAPTYRMLADTTRLALLELCVEKSIPHLFAKADNNLILTEPMSEIRFRSADDPSKLVGSNLAWFGCDELTFTHENAWERLEARLRDPRAEQLSGFATWTPKGHDWVWRRFVGPRKIKGYECLFALPGENRHVLDKTPDYYERLQNSYEDSYFRQEALGEYIGTGGSKPYFAFDQTKDVEKLNFDPRYGIFWSLDFNVNPMCSVIGQRIPGNPDRIHILQEQYLKQANTRMAFEEFVRRTRQYVHRRSPLEVEVMGDSTGRARDTTSELQSDWDIVFQGFRQYPDYKPIRRVEPNPPTRSRIVSVNSALCNAAGMRRVTIDEKCVELINDLELCKWAEDSKGNTLNEIDDSDKMRGHLGDAIGYAIWTVLRIMQTVGPQR